MTNVDPTQKMDEKIQEKKLKQDQLNFAINDYISLKLQYTQKSNELLLNTDFKELKLTNEKMRNAFIEENLSTLKMELEISKANVASIKRDIDVINDEIKLYELLHVRLYE